MNKNNLIVKNNENRIDSLVRNNNIIKSKFHFEKPLTFCVVHLAVQKVKINHHKNGLVIITKDEILRMTQGRDTKLGVNELIKRIRRDLHTNNYFNSYQPSSGLSDIKQVLIKLTGRTEDVYRDLAIVFDNSVLTNFNFTCADNKNYTIQRLRNLSKCGTNKTLTLYALNQPYAETYSPNYVLTVDEIRHYLHIKKDEYSQVSNLSLAIKRICIKVSNETDLNLTVNPLKKRKRIHAFEFIASLKKESLQKPQKIPKFKQNHSNLITALNKT